MMYLLILLIVVILTCIHKRENFTSLSYCGNCGHNNYYNCMNCVDCGFCVNEYGSGECLPGDRRGPYFRDDCIHWHYNRPFRYFI